MGVKKRISLDNYKDSIKKYNKDIICPNLDINYTNINTNSCFDIQKYEQYQEFNNINIKFTDTTDNSTNYNLCKKVKLYPNNTQKRIINKWLYSYLEMYNITINHIKNNIKNHDFKLLKDTYNKKKTLEKELKKIEKNKKNFEKEKIKQKNKLDKKYIIKRKTQKNKNEINELVSQIRSSNKNIKLSNMNIDSINVKISKINMVYMKLSNKIGNFLDWYIVRNTIKDKRDNLRNEMFKNDDKPIKIHILDCAIKQACTMYNQCKTNHMKNNIKKFRIKFWRKNKKTLQMEIGSEFVKQLKEDKTFNICYDIFGKLKCSYNNKPYEIEKKTVNIHYNQIDRKYTLLVSDTKPIIPTKKTKYIAIDEGIRTFCTGITNNEVIKIGTNISPKIGNYLSRIDNINGIEGLTQKEKAIKSRKYYRKINNLVTELHWKTIKYITSNYKNIVIGNLSMKNASQCNKISKMTKRIGLLLSHYTFKQRLQYKCATTKNSIEIIDESYTSKICSNCGNYNKKLGDSKIYDCQNCHMKIDRDINGCRGILIKSLE